MENDFNQFTTELASQIKTLEADRQNYQQVFDIIKRNNVSRIFRKAINIILEIVAHLLLVASVIGVVLLSFGRDELIQELDRHLITHIPDTGELLVESIKIIFLIAQLLAVIIGMIAAFCAYLLRKVRRRNNALKDVTDLLENTLEASANNIAKAKHTEHSIWEWKLKKAKVKENEALINEDI